MSNVTSYRVTGDWRHIVDDGMVDVDDLPDEVLPTGTVKFRPLYPTVATAGVPATAYTFGTVPALIAGGVLTDLQGREGVRLAGKVGEHTVRWSAEIELTFQGQKVSYPSPVAFELDQDTVLSAIIQQAGRAMTPIVLDPRVEALAGRLAEADEIVQSVEGYASDAAGAVGLAKAEADRAIGLAGAQDEHIAGTLEDPESATHAALKAVGNATYVPKSELPTPAGMVAVISDTEPPATNQDGIPVVWFKTVYNTIPEVQSISLAGNGLTVTASFVGFDADGDTLAYAVDWGDGATTSDAASPADHTYAAEGTYTVRVYVTDQWGATASATASIFVVPAIPNRWAFESFTRPDGTILAGWTADTTKNSPAATTEEGGLTWEPGDQTTGGNQTYMKAHVSGGRFVQGTPVGTLDGNQVGQATLPLPASSYRVAFRYAITPEGVRDTLSRVALYLSCSPTTARSTSGTTSLSVRLLDDLRMQLHTQSNGAFTAVTDVTNIPRSGRLEATFDAATGAVTIAIDGTQYWSGTYAGPAHGKVGIDTRRLGAIDDFEVGPL